MITNLSPAPVISRLSRPSGPAAVQPVIRARGINHFFGEGENRKQVLFDNNLEVVPGEIVIMTGPSGSGKTTLLTLIGALRTVQEGSLEVLGRELRDLDSHQLVEVRRDIGFIFQAHNLFDSLTAYENVRTGLELLHQGACERNARIIEVLNTLELGNRIGYKPEALSGGQRQRVAIARALVHHPHLILADEPTAALDRETGRKVVQLLHNLAETERTAIIIVTHDNRILDVAHRIVNLVDGRIVSNVPVKESVAVCLFLTKCPAFASLTPDALTQVADKLTRERFPAGAVIIRQGDPGDKFYLIRRGTVDVIVNEGLPTRRVVAQLKEGDFFGEMALLTGEPRNATVVAREQLDTYTLGKEDFQTAINTSAPIREQLYKVYFQRH
jgi:putative ABC transport system ATP-binding protein